MAARAVKQDIVCIFDTESDDGEEKEVVILAAPPKYERAFNHAELLEKHISDNLSLDYSCGTVRFSFDSTHNLQENASTALNKIVDTTFHMWAMSKAAQRQYGIGEQPMVHQFIVAFLPKGSKDSDRCEVFSTCPTVNASLERARELLRDVVREFTGSPEFTYAEDERFHSDSKSSDSVAVMLQATRSYLPDFVVGMRWFTWTFD